MGSFSKRLLPYGKGKLPIDGIINVEQVVIIFAIPTAVKHRILKFIKSRNTR